MTSDQVRSKALLDALQLESNDELQDLLCSLILSECVYKAVDYNQDAALDAISTFTSQFPLGAVVEISAVQFCRNRVSHKYLLATGSSSTSSSPALYVAFMGTKELRDVAVDVAVGPRTLFTVHGGNARGGESMTNNGGEEAAEVAEESIVVAHGGFLSRAQSIPAASLLLHALQQNMRLVFCGHSLGGAVATLVMLRLLSSLQHLPAPHQLRCITFGMPALGTSALGVHIDTQGWGRYFTLYALPEDPVPRLHLSRSRIRGASAGRDGGGGGSTGSNCSNASGSEINRRNSGEESEEEELLVEGLYQEETPSFDNVDNATLTEENNDKPQWSVLREVARKARIAGAAIPRLISLPPFLSYAHFGTPLYLLSTGVSYSNKENASSASASTAPPAILLPQGLLANHRMPAYRSRILEICHKYHSNENLPNEQNSNNTSTKEVFNLAPSVTATTVETSLPILYTRSPPSGLEKVTMVVRVQGKGLDVCTGASLHFGGNSGGGNANGGVPLTVFGRAVDVDKAKQLVLEKTNQLLAGNNNNEKEKAAAAAGGGGGHSLLQTLGEKFLPRAGRSSSNENVDSTLPVVEFVFEVPVEALLQLQIYDSPSSSIQIKMDLISDFAKTPVSVHCIPQIAWIFSLDTQLGDAVFSELVETAQQDAEGAAAAARRVIARSLQGRKSKQKRSSPQVDHNLAKDTDKKDQISTHEAESAPLLSLIDKIFQWLTKPILKTSTTLPLDSTSVVSPPPPPPLRSVLYRGLLIIDISNVLNESTSSSIKKLQLAAELLKWTAAQRNGQSLSNSSSSNTDLWDDLGVPAHEHEYYSLLQKDQTLGTRLKQQLRRAISSVSLPLPSPPLPPLLPSLPLLGKGAANKHRIRLWEQLFKDLPVDSPNIVVILASGETLKNPVNKSKGTPSSSTALKNKISGGGATSGTTNITTTANGSIVSNEFNLSLLDAMHAVAVASGHCHAAALLGVAASEAKDPAYRRRLSFSSGLYGRPGAVVPLYWQTRILEKEKIEKERKRQPFLNVSMLQAALLSHASAAQISNLQNDSSETIRRDGDASIKNTLRARL